jgi:hypothetical protein
MGVEPVAAPQALMGMISAAGGRSGVDFDYLLQTAIRESSLNPAARAATSTATGLFQFLESSWLEVMKTEGPRLGYGAYADAISVTADGDYAVADKTMRQKILALREDPGIASDLAAAFTRNNGDYLTAQFGRRPSAGELYIAHFLGARGAAKLFEAGLADPEQSAAKLFARQAKANPTIFYEKGRERSIREVYLSLVDKHRGPTATAAFAAQQMAGTARSAGPLAYAPLAGTVSPLALPDGSELASPAPTGPGPTGPGPTGPLARSEATAPTGAIPSRFGPADASALLQAERAPAPRVLMTQAGQ